MAENTNTEREAFEAFWLEERKRTWLASGCHKHRGEEPSINWAEGSKEDAWRGWQARASLSLPAAGQEPPPIHALMCVISSLRDTAHFSDEEGEVTDDLRKLRGWIVERAAAPQPAVAAGWVSVKDRLPPCRDDQDYIGINSAGFAGIFNAVADIAGNVHCMMETAEESVSIMSDLDIWKPFIRPPLASEAGDA